MAHIVVIPRAAAKARRHPSAVASWLARIADEVRRPRPDGLTELEREVNRIRLQSRHWLA